MRIIALLLLPFFLGGCVYETAPAVFNGGAVISQIPVHEQIANKSAAEKATIKGQEIAKIKSVAKTQRSKYQIEIVDIKAIDGGVEVFAKAWNKNGQIGFGKDGTVDIERFVIINPPILVDDPNGDIVRTWTDELTGETKTRKLREDLQEAVLQSLEHTISIKKQKFGDDKIQAGKVGNTTLTAYPQAGTGTAPIDGNLRRLSVDETYGTIRGGVGNAHNDTGTDTRFALSSNTTTDHFDEMYRTGVGFVTSSIGTDAIDSAILSVQGTTRFTGLGTPNIEVTAFTPADGSDFANGDYDVGNYGSTRFITPVSIGGLSVDGPGGTYNDLTFNASGEAAINKSGNTFFGLRDSWDFNNSFGGTWTSAGDTAFVMVSADQAGTTSDPKLVVEHSVAAAVDTGVGTYFWGEE